MVTKMVIVSKVDPSFFGDLLTHPYERTAMRKVIISIPNLNIPDNHSSMLVQAAEYSMQVDYKVFNVGMMTERQDGVWDKLNSDDKLVHIYDMLTSLLPHQDAPEASTGFNKQQMATAVMDLGFLTVRKFEETTSLLCNESMSKPEMFFIVRLSKAEDGLLDLHLETQSKKELQELYSNIMPTIGNA